jgi:hypothetical protein
MGALKFVRVGINAAIDQPGEFFQARLFDAILAGHDFN